MILLGAEEKKYTCPSCGMVHYGRPDGGNCQKCGEVKNGMWEVLPIEEHEKIPYGLCHDCEEEQKEHRKLVEAGGVYWKCSVCSATGVIRPSEFARQVREKMTIPAPGLCGVEFEGLEGNPVCPACAQRAVNPDPVAIPEDKPEPK